MSGVKIEFGEYSKTVFQHHKPSEKRKGGSSVKTYEVNKQNFVIQSGPKKGQTVTSASSRVVFNCGFALSDALFDQLMPDYANWKSLAASGKCEEDISDIFKASPLSAAFENIHFSKSMLRWFSQTPGFGPCFAFSSDATPSSKIGQAVERVVSDANGYKHMLFADGIGIYRGPKGKNRMTDRKTLRSHKLTDPLMAKGDDGQPYIADDINLDFKFCLGTKSGGGVTIPLQRFHFGDKPLVTCCFNVHLKRATPRDAAITNWSDLEQVIAHQMGGFQDFAVKTLKTRDLLTPSHIKRINGWKAKPERYRFYSPWHPDYKTAIVNGDPTIQPTRTVVLPKPEYKDASSSDSDSSDSPVLTRKSAFALFGIDSDSEDGYVEKECLTPDCK